MSEHAPATATEDLFSRDELNQFEADDVGAGGAIGKMLSCFFLYTVLAMSLVFWWTWRTTTDSSAPAAAAAEH